MNVRAVAARSGQTDITAAGRTHPIGRVGRRRILHAFLIGTLGYTSDGARGEVEGLDRSLSDAMVERLDNHLRASSHVPPTQAPHFRPAVMKLTNARSGGELAIVRVSPVQPALLAYLTNLGLAAETRLTVGKNRSNSAVMTIRIQGQAREIHLGSVASDALWVESAAAV